MDNNKKILITGGAGFIGSQVTKALLERGDNVVVVDNFNEYYDSSLKRARVEKLLNGFDNFELIEVDIGDYERLEKIFKAKKIDKVCHLAAQAGVRYSLENPFIYAHTNYLGTLNLLELCRRYDVKDFIFASSSSVYGHTEAKIFKEADRTDTPISLYAATKKANEEAAYTYHHLYGMNCFGLRFFTVYGPWGRPDMALFKFTKAILAGEPIDVYNHGKMARDFTYIKDIADGTVLAIDKTSGYEIFNLARGESIELIKFIDELEKSLGKKTKKNMMALQPGDVQSTSADISKARKKLGYDPQISISEGIENFAKWYSDYYGK